MNKLNFQTAISYGEHKQGIVDHLVEAFDDYFYFKGKKACVISNDRLHAHLQEMPQSSMPRIALKVIQFISYFTLVIPLSMLLGKIILRSIRKIELIDIRVANRNFLFLAKRTERSQEGCCGKISAKVMNLAVKRLQEKAPAGILFDSSLYGKHASIIGTCTAMSLEFASAYFNLCKEFKDVSHNSESFINKMRLFKANFQTSSEEIRSRQFAYSCVKVDQTVKMDVSKAKVESYMNYHDFETDYWSKEVDLTADKSVLQQEINKLPYGIYFIRMLKPADNHKLEARAHSMIYVHEKDVGFFYDNNWGLEKISAMDCSTGGIELYERLLNVHTEWDIPMVRFYSLKPPFTDQLALSYSSKPEKLINQSQDASSNLSTCTSKFHQAQRESTKASRHVLEELERLRPWPTFSEYQTFQKENGNPVDLIVGRGTKNNYADKYSPQLYLKRPILDEWGCHSDQLLPYNPYTIDILPAALADSQADISAPRGMTAFPVASIDEIYLERLYPLFTQSCIHTYANAARILRVGGILIVDCNGLCRLSEEKEMAQEFAAILQEAGLPLGVYRGNIVRSELFGKPFEKGKFAFIKFDHFDNFLFDPHVLRKAHRALQRACKNFSRT